MNLSIKQEEWSKLLLPAATPDVYIPPDESMFGSLDHLDRKRLAAYWLSDGLHARLIDYPQSKEELSYYSWARSGFMRYFFNISVIIQIILPFFEESGCGGSIQSSHGQLFLNGYPTRLALTIFDCLCLIIYVVDVYIIFSIDPSKKRFLERPAGSFRLLVCTFIFFDCIMYLSGVANSNLARGFFPFVLLSRRHNLKVMLSGLAIAVYNAIPVLRALGTILVIFGFCGYFLFQYMSIPEFNTPISSFFTVLHCFTSRPYVLRIMNPVFKRNEASTIFFIALTLASDLLCLNLIVAVGSKHYKLFAASELKNRMNERRQSIACTFYAMSDIFAHQQEVTTVSARRNEIIAMTAMEEEEGLLEKDKDPYSTCRGRFVSRHAWLNLCARLKNKYRLTCNNAHLIFDVVCQGDDRSAVEKAKWYGHKGTPPAADVEYLDMYLFFRAVGLVSGNLCVKGVSRHATVSKRGRRHTVKLDVRRLHGSTAITKGSDILDKDSAMALAAIQKKKPDAAAASSAGNDRATNASIEEASSSISTITSNPSIIGTESIGFKSLADISAHNVKTQPAGEDGVETPSDPWSVDWEDSQLKGEVDTYIKEKYPSDILLEINDGKPDKDSSSSNKLFSMGKFRAVRHLITASPYFIALRGLTKKSLTMFIEVYWGWWSDPESLVDPSKYIKFNVFNLVQFLWHMVLVVQVSLISRVVGIWSSKLLWFGWAVWCGFFLLMLVFMGAIGTRKYFNRKNHIAEFFLNFATFVTLCVMTGPGKQSFKYSYEHSVLNISLVVYIVLQCLRLLSKIFFQFNDSDYHLINHVYPVLIRAAFLYGCVLYFFAMFAQTFYCGFISVDAAENNSNPENDASSWAPYHNLLNFGTYLQSLFTMFEMSLLANWSMVMDAAVVSTNHAGQYGPYIFFYVFRLLLTLCVLPILVAFIMQAYLSALNNREAVYQQQKRADAQLMANDEEAVKKQQQREATRLAAKNKLKSEYKDAHTGEEISTTPSAEKSGRKRRKERVKKRMDSRAHSPMGSRGDSFASDTSEGAGMRTDPLGLLKPEGALSLEHPYRDREESFDSVSERSSDNDDDDPSPSSPIPTAAEAAAEPGHLRRVPTYASQTSRASFNVTTNPLQTDEITDDAFEAALTAEQRASESSAMTAASPIPRWKMAEFKARYETKMKLLAQARNPQKSKSITNKGRTRSITATSSSTTINRAVMAEVAATMRANDALGMENPADGTEALTREQQQQQELESTGYGFPIASRLLFIWEDLYDRFAVGFDELLTHTGELNDVTYTFVRCNDETHHLSASLMISFFTRSQASMESIWTFVDPPKPLPPIDATATVRKGGVKSTKIPTSSPDASPSVGSGLKKSASATFKPSFDANIEADSNSPVLKLPAPDVSPTPSAVEAQAKEIESLRAQLDSAQRALELMKWEQRNRSPNVADSAPAASVVEVTASGLQDVTVTSDRAQTTPAPAAVYADADTDADADTNGAAAEVGADVNATPTRQEKGVGADEKEE